MPVENLEYQRYMTEKNRILLKPERGTTIISDFRETRGNLMAPGSNAALSKFTNFTVSAVLHTLVRPINPYTRKLPGLLAVRPKKQRLLVCPKMNCWISFTIASNDIDTGQ